MTAIGHNSERFDGSEGDDIRMHIARIHVSDILNGMRTLSMEERGFYCTALFTMYDRMGDLPADDRAASIAIGCDIRTYRRLKTRMLDLNKFKPKPDGRLTNDRVTREITAYCEEVKRRRQAALEREEKRRQEQEAARVADEMRKRSEELPPDFEANSAGSPGEVGATSGESPAEVQQQVSRKPNKNNETPTIAEPQSYYELWSTPKPKPKPKPSKGIGVCVDGARPGEDEVAPGLYVNCDTVRHRDFVLSISSIAMQLALANLGLSKNDATTLARESSIAHAMQWSAEISAGKDARAVLPAHPANFVRGAVISQHNRQEAQRNAKPSHWRGVTRASTRRADGAAFLQAAADIEAEESGIIGTPYKVVNP